VQFTAKQLELLEIIGDRGDTTLDMAAFLLCTSHQATGRIFAALSSKGLAYRFHSLSNGTEYWITDKGGRLLKRQERK